MPTHPVIFFDGVCNLCNASVQFVLTHEKRDYFRFSALQGDYVRKLLPQFDIEIGNSNSVVLLENGLLYTKSTAALRIARRLNGLWPLLYSLIIVPKFLRDWVYNIIAKNRYKWWGRQETCWVPTPELKTKFYS
ncbi:thiol-disulfide oxidoreductase DCC family protein [Pedobacter sp. AW1-32]|uniref:thiol-disulfide oxidoreductase DCC family protein n=1 Tax=Pedobacter sp. AW1-32 TaxID=3383026 RepID=UPI003FF096D4